MKALQFILFEYNGNVVNIPRIWKKVNNQRSNQKFFFLPIERKGAMGFRGSSIGIDDL